MEWTPVPIAEFLLFHLGSLARPGALLGAMAVTMATCGLAAAVRAGAGCGRVRQMAGTLSATALLAVVYLLVFPPSDSAPALCLIVSAVACITIFSLRPGGAPGRREWLRQNALVGGGLILLLSIFSVDPLLRALALKRFFAFRRPSGLRVAGLSDLVTKPTDFYLMDKVLQYPQVGPPGWQLSIDGLVRTPSSLDYGALTGRASQSRYVTMECVDNPVGGPLMGTALFTGVPVVDLLRAAGAIGDTVVFHSSDNYAEAVSRQVLEAHGAMIVYAMNGEALPREHGYPARLILPGVYGFKSVKWLTRIEVVDGQYADNWRTQGWTDVGIVHPTARIDVARREREEILVAGVAFAGVRGVRSVQVRVNGGSWHAATLGPRLSHEAWVQWAVRLRGDGPARIEARTIDGDGRAQTGTDHGAYPDGSTGWHTVRV